MKTQYKFGAILLITLVLGGTIGYTIAQSGTTFIITQGVYSGAPEYTVYIEDSTYYAKNDYGRIDYSNTNFTTVWNNIYGNDREIYLKAGNYYTGRTLNASAHNLTIRGSGMWNTMIYATANLGDVASQFSGIFYVGFVNGERAKNVVIRDIGFDAQGYSMGAILWWNKAEDGIAERIYVTDALVEGGYIDMGCATWRCIIINCYGRTGTNGNHNQGIFHICGAYGSIMNCRTYGGSTGDPAIEGCENGGSIIGNQLHNPYHGIRIDTGYRNKTTTVVGNFIYNAQGDAIKVKQDSGNSTIDGNTIRRTKGRGIVVPSGADNTIITNNLITDMNGTDKHGIEIDADYCVVEGNEIIETSHGCGIWLRTNYTVVDNNIVVGANTDGIVLKGYSLYNIISGNIVKDNGDDGIEERDTTDYSVIYGNIARDNTGANIFVIGTNTKVNLCWNGTTWIP